MVKVRLEGLKIARARGKYYVYVRATGEAILRGFEGSKESLRKRLAQPDMIGAYNVRRRRKRAWPEQSLGWLVEWFTDPTKCSDFKKLSKTTQDEYKDRLKFLEGEFDFPLSALTTAHIYEVRDKCLQEKWPAYTDKLMTAMSSMFKLAVPRGWMAFNPAQGIKRASKADPDANREWTLEEWHTVISHAPKHLETAYMIARYAGYRSQSIVAVEWKHYQPDANFGMCLRMRHKKNAQLHWIPAAPVLQAHLDMIRPEEAEGPIALRRGKPWGDAYKLQKASSNFLRKLAKDGLVGPGLTEHGLRVTFAAEIKRLTGANDDQVAAALGDRDARMGAHYTRHVEQESKLLFLWAQKARTEQDLENGKKDVFQIENSGIIDKDLEE